MYTKIAQYNTRTNERVCNYKDILHKKNVVYNQSLTECKLP